jgi:hypothetical protein
MSAQYAKQVQNEREDIEEMTKIAKVEGINRRPFVRTESEVIWCTW